MARGKHGRAAAQRRAQSAEEQLDRLLPQLTDAKRTATRFKAEAESAIALRAELAKLRDTVGVPVAEHEQVVADLQARHREVVTEMVAATKELFDQFARWVVLDLDANWISSGLVRAAQAAPEDIAVAFLDALGVERETRRMILTVDPDLMSHNAEVRRDLVTMQMKSREMGASDGKIYSHLLGRDASNPDWVEHYGKTEDVEQATETWLDAVLLFCDHRDGNNDGRGPRLQKVFRTHNDLVTIRSTAAKRARRHADDG